MSENIEGQQMPEVGQAPRVARSASSQPLIGADQVQAHEGASSASGGVKVREKRRGGAPRARPKYQYRSYRQLWHTSAS